MTKFYLADPDIQTVGLSRLQFQIYHYLCQNYNVKKHEPFVRIVAIGGMFQLSKEEVQAELVELTKYKLQELPLLTISKQKYFEFTMPAHKKFLESVGFKKFSQQGWKTLNSHLNQVHEQEQKIDYLFPNFDQYELYDHLDDLPTDELNKIDKAKLKYPWMYDKVIKART